MRNTLIIAAFAVGFALSLGLQGHIWVAAMTWADACHLDAAACGPLASVATAYLASFDY